MGKIWDADVEIGEERASRLLTRQFPALAPVQVEPLGIGWDNAAFLVNGDLVFRFPRRQIAAGLIAREIRILPMLAPHLPLPIPTPTFVGQPEADYPYPFAGYALLSGTTACRLAWSEEERTRAAVPLAALLAALHRIPIPDATRLWAPGDEIERTNLPKRARTAQERLHKIAPTLHGLEADLLHDRLDQLAMTPPSSEPPCWLHGDLYVRHLLADESRHLCGVIDWGDVHLGDRALDLSIAFSFLPSEARSVFRETYGPIDDATWDRARFRALYYGAVLVEYGLDIGDEAIRAAGEYALRAASA